MPYANFLLAGRVNGKQARGFENIKRFDQQKIALGILQGVNGLFQGDDVFFIDLHARKDLGQERNRAARRSLSSQRHGEQGFHDHFTIKAIPVL